MLGLKRKTGSDQDSKATKREKDGEEKSGLPAVRGMSDRSRKVTGQQKSSKGL